ncbi:MAG: hypothetical protein KDK34_19750 [Leptospiraceae bacterium]|nr:hypothetical protein [Leptospiraceae bacterium]
MNFTLVPPHGLTRRLGIMLICCLAPALTTPLMANSESDQDVADQLSRNGAAMRTTNARHMNESEHSEDSVGGNSNAPAQTEWPTQSFRAVVRRGDGREVRGTLQIRAPETIIIRHVHQDNEYEKVVRVRDIEQIEIKRWQGRVINQKEEGAVYQFDVSQFEISIAGQEPINIYGQLPVFFRELVIENEHGRIYLFSFWLDLLKNEGGWWTGMEGPANGSRVVCHSDVIKTIELSSGRITESHPE